MRAMKILTGKRPGGHARRGAAAIELAVILPLFLLLTFGAIDFGRFAARAIAVDNAARAGAGYGIVHPYTTGTQATWANAMKQAVTDEMQSMFDSRFGSSNLTVSYLLSNDTGSRWRIRVTVTFPFRTTITWPGIPHQFNITQSVEMRG